MTNILCVGVQTPYVQCYKETHSASGRIVCLGRWYAGQRPSVTDNSFPRPPRTNRRFWVKPSHLFASRSWLSRSLLQVSASQKILIVSHAAVVLFFFFSNTMLTSSATTKCYVYASSSWYVYTTQTTDTSLIFFLVQTGPAQSGILFDREVVNLFLHFTVNPKPRVDYIDRPRCCLRGEECSINRFQQVESRWGYSGTSDRIRWDDEHRQSVVNLRKCAEVLCFSFFSFCVSLYRFNVNRRISIVGFGLYGSIHGPTDYQVNIQVTLALRNNDRKTSQCEYHHCVCNLRFLMKKFKSTPFSVSYNFFCCQYYSVICRDHCWWRK